MESRQIGGRAPCGPIEGGADGTRTPPLNLSNLSRHRFPPLDHLVLRPPPGLRLFPKADRPRQMRRR